MGAWRGGGCLYGFAFCMIENTIAALFHTYTNQIPIKTPSVKAAAPLIEIPVILSHIQSQPFARSLWN